MIRRLFRERPVAMTGGTVAFACFLVMAVFVMVDNTQFLGIDRWVKPAKFFISIAIFLWTVGAYLYFLPESERFSRRISWAIIVIFTIEMAIIVGPAARGAKSHFNTTTPINGALYTVMGLAILTNTFLVAVMAYRYFRNKVTSVSPALLWGMRLGLIIFLVGSVVGAYMSAQTGHTVGAVDGGPGLPFVNWSTVAGDLRIAHFLGMHGLQAVPVAAIIFEKLTPAVSTTLTIIFSALYLVIVVGTFVQALIGVPLTL